jgi:hypothetical protein
VLEVLMLSAIGIQAAPQAAPNRPDPPSLELLEFLGEFGDDEDGLLDAEAPVKEKEATRTPPARRAPAPAPPGSMAPAAPPATQAPPAKVAP